MSEQVKKPSVRNNMSPSIKRRLDELGLTVNTLAQKINVSPMTLYNVLGGRSEPSLGLAAKIAWGLGWNLDYFVCEFFTSHPLAGITQLGKITHASDVKPLVFTSVA